VSGPEGAREARGVVVVIDVLRAFTVSAVAFARGATRCVLVTSVEEARRLHEEIPGSVLSAEERGLPIPGIEISNSPTMVAQLELAARTLIQRTSAGTQAIAALQASRGVEAMFAGSLVVAAATAQAVLLRRPRLVTLVASGAPDHLEDRACALLLETALRGRPAAAAELLRPFLASRRYRELRSNSTRGFPPSDLDIALDVDRYRFAMPARLKEGLIELEKQDLTKI